MLPMISLTNSHLEHLLHMIIILSHLSTLPIFSLSIILLELFILLWKWLPYNQYKQQNLAFSLQMQLKAKSYFPDFVRKIYLKAYKYNLDLKPRAVLVEVGGQTNTLEEAKNAMEPFAKILVEVLS